MAVPKLRPVDVRDVVAGRPAGVPFAVVRDAGRTIIGLRPTEVRQANGADALVELDGLTEGWWAGFISYDLGRSIERIPARSLPTGLPDVVFVRFESRIAIDDSGAIAVDGAECDIDDLLTTSGFAKPCAEPLRWRSSLERTEYLRAVAAIREHLLAGDCYQVNLTRLVSTDAALDPFWLFDTLRDRNPAPHEALISVGSMAVVSASPESFLRVDGRRVVTRPIKGTSSDGQQLRDSAKDRAENVMIVDLARNDLGRVCEYGTVHARELFAIEQHPGLYHLVSTVEGRLREDVTLSELIRATFPPASVTGCPKPRVLEIIEELEPHRRGVYCGAVGFVDADREICDLNVAIRTFTIADGKTTLGVGGAIVADSDPGAEWEETELKARRLLEIAGAG